MYSLFIICIIHPPRTIHQTWSSLHHKPFVKQHFYTMQILHSAAGAIHPSSTIYTRTCMHDALAIASQDRHREGKWKRWEGGGRVNTLSHISRTTTQYLATYFIMHHATCTSPHNNYHALLAMQYPPQSAIRNPHLYMQSIYIMQDRPSSMLRIWVTTRHITSNVSHTYHTAHISCVIQTAHEHISQITQRTINIYIYI